MALKIIYMILIAIFTVLFVGLGISAFYERPTAPIFPQNYKIEIAPDQNSKEVKEYEKKYEEFRNKEKAYNRNVSIISLVVAVVIVLISVVLSNRALIVSDGLLLGGLFVMIYSIINGFGADNAKLRFILASFGLLMVLGLGYWKFIWNEEKK